MDGHDKVHRPSQENRDTYMEFWNSDLGLKEFSVFTTQEVVLAGVEKA